MPAKDSDLVAARPDRVPTTEDSIGEPARDGKVAGDQDSPPTDGPEVSRRALLRAVGAGAAAAALPGTTATPAGATQDCPGPAEPLERPGETDDLTVLGHDVTLIPVRGTCADWHSYVRNSWETPMFSIDVAAETEDADVIMGAFERRFTYEGEVIAEAEDLPVEDTVQVERHEGAAEVEGWDVLEITGLDGEFGVQSNVAIPYWDPTYTVDEECRRAYCDLFWEIARHEIQHAEDAAQLAERAPEIAADVIAEGEYGIEFDPDAEEDSPHMEQVRELLGDEVEAILGETAERLRCRSEGRTEEFHDLTDDREEYVTDLEADDGVDSNDELAEWICDRCETCETDQRNLADVESWELLVRHQWQAQVLIDEEDGLSITHYQTYQGRYRLEPDRFLPDVIHRIYSVIGAIANFLTGLFGDDGDRRLPRYGPPLNWCGRGAASAFYENQLWAGGLSLATQTWGGQDQPGGAARLQFDRAEDQFMVDWPYADVPAHLSIDPRAPPDAPFDPFEAWEQMADPAGEELPLQGGTIGLAQGKGEDGLSDSIPFGEELDPDGLIDVAAAPPWMPVPECHNDLSGTVAHPLQRAHEHAGPYNRLAFSPDGTGPVVGFERTSWLLRPVEFIEEVSEPIDCGAPDFQPYGLDLPDRDYGCD